MDWTLDVTEFDRLQRTMKNFPGSAEKSINDVLHNDANPLIKDAVQRLTPVSDKKKGTHAKFAQSLTDEKGNLFITVKTTKKYQYLYFPDDGTNTRRHAGNQQFFLRGGESQQDEIVDRCINKLVNNFEQAI